MNTPAVQRLCAHRKSSNRLQCVRRRSCWTRWARMTGSAPRARRPGAFTEQPTHVLLVPHTVRSVFTMRPAQAHSAGPVPILADCRLPYCWAKAASCYYANVIILCPEWSACSRRALVGWMELVRPICCADSTFCAQGRGLSASGGPQEGLRQEARPRGAPWLPVDGVIFWPGV